MREWIGKHARELQRDRGDFCDYMVEDWGVAAESAKKESSESAAEGAQKIIGEYLSIVESISEMECIDSDVENGVIHLFLSAPVPPLGQVRDNEQDWSDVEADMSFYDVSVEICSDGDSWWFGASDEDGREIFAGAEGRGKEGFKAAFAKMVDSLGIKATKSKRAGMSVRRWFETRPDSGRYEQKYADASGYGCEIGDAILFWPDGVCYRNMQGHPAVFVLNKKHMDPCKLFYYKDGSSRYCGSQYYEKEPWLFDSLSGTRRA